MDTMTRRRAGTTLMLALAASVVGFTCDHPTDTLLQPEEATSAVLAAGPVDGVVTAAGSPLAGVDITLKGGGGTYKARTDAAGVFQLASVPGGSYTATARALGVTGLPLDVQLSLGSVSVDGGARLEVEVPTHRWTFRVLLGGQPLPGGRVECLIEVRVPLAEGRVATGTQLLKGFVGADGTFSTPVLPNASGGGCAVLPLNTRWMIGFLAPAATGDWTKTVHVPSLVYRGVVSARGTPLAGQSLRVFGTLDRSTTTEEDGAYAVTLVPGDYAIELSGDGSGAGGVLPLDYALEGRGGDGLGERRISGTTTEPLDLPVAHLTLTVTGPGGEPVEGATIEREVVGTSFALGAWRITDGAYRVSGTSGADGVLRLPLFPRGDTLQLAVRAPEGTTLLDGALTLASVAGDVAETLSLVSANTAPTAVAGGPYALDEGGTVMLDGSASTDPDGDALTYAWLLPDGSTVEGATATLSFGDGPAEHTAVLTVTDPAGLSSSAEALITVANIAPTVTAAGATLTSGGSFDLTASFTDPGADAWRWHVDWGNGRTAEGDATSGTIVVASPTFLATGDHVVRVTVTDDDGDAGTADALVRVEAAAISIDVLPGSAENVIQLGGNGNGVLPVTVHGTADFGPAALDVTTIRLSADGEGGAPVAVRRNGTPMAALEDVNGDGLPDLVLHFDRAQVSAGLTSSSTRLVLRGTTDAGIEVRGEDAVRPK